MQNYKRGALARHGVHHHISVGCELYGAQMPRELAWMGKVEGTLCLAVLIPLQWAEPQDVN